jgi:hypothetical protein
MIQLLTDEEQKTVNKKVLSDLEAQILIKLGFDFNFPGPMQFVERYLRIHGFDKNKSVYDICFSLCKLALLEPKFLDYKPSQIAACASILAVNINQRDKNHNEFFRQSNGG